jgi:hypothetical protein
VVKSLNGSKMLAIDDRNEIYISEYFTEQDPTFQEIDDWIFSLSEKQLDKYVPTIYKLSLFKNDTILLIFCIS